MLISTERELLTAYRQMVKFLALSLSDVVFILLMNVKNAKNSWHFNIYEREEFRAQLS